MILFKAKKEYGNEEVEGWYYGEKDNECLFLENQEQAEHIKPETLMISFDGGSTWYPINELRDIIDSYEGKSMPIDWDGTI
jgi:hypothetical protein